MKTGHKVYYWINSEKKIETTKTKWSALKLCMALEGEMKWNNGTDFWCLHCMKRDKCENWVAKWKKNYIGHKNGKFWIRCFTPNFVEEDGE